jgi:hypothetical protein
LRVWLKLPVQNEWLGYDFEVADWVAPHGKGKNVDILFKEGSEGVRSFSVTFYPMNNKRGNQ